MARIRPRAAHRRLLPLFALCLATVCRAQESVPAVEALPGVANEDAESGRATAEGEEVTVTARRRRLLTPLPGVVLDEDAASTNIQVRSGLDIRESGATHTTQFLNEQLQSVTVADNTGNPFQQDVVFRGFSASPLIATPQGLSVYLDGVRVNEAFGDVVNWDLVPLNAIDSLALLPGSNPLFGLNSLGGALALNTKSGFTAEGVEASLSGGSWERQQLQLAAGVNDGFAAGFLAFNRLREEGWRVDSPSEINQVFGRFDLAPAFGQFTVSALYVDNALRGNGQAPAEDVRENPEQVYTSPDGVENRLLHIWLTARADLHETLSATALAHQRDARQDAVNGDFWDDWDAASAGRVDACDPLGANGVADGVPGNNLLADGANIDGGTGPGVPGCIPNGVLGLGTTDQTTRGYALQLNWALDQNQLALGATYDDNNVFFEQSEQLGDISPTREIVIDPDRPFPFDQDDLLAFQQFLDLLADRAELQAFLEQIFPGDTATQQAFLDFIFGLLPNPPPTAPATRVGDLFAATEFPIVRNRLRGDNANWAVFFQNVFTAWDTLNISVGARYSVTKVSNRVEADRPTPLYQFSPALIARREERCGVEDGDADARYQCTAEAFEYVAFNPALGLSWDATPTLTVFANVSRGSRAPSAIELACARDKGEVDPDIFQGCTVPTALTNDPFLPQVRSTTWEFGGRGLLRDYLDWNAAAFKTDLKDDILFVALGVGNRGVFDTFGRTRRLGFELGLRGEGDRLRWYLNYSHVRATFENEATVINLSNSTSRKVQGEINEFQIEPGDTIPGVPRHVLRAGVSFDITPRATLGLTALAQASSFVRGNENNDHAPGGTDADGTGRARRYVGEGEISGFAVFNLDARYAVTQRMSLFLEIDNLFDKRFATAGQLGLNTFTESRFGARDEAGFNSNSNDWTHSQFVGPGAPRAAWMGLRYAFD